MWRARLPMRCEGVDLEMDCPVQYLRPTLVWPLLLLLVSGGADEEEAAAAGLGLGLAAVTAPAAGAGRQQDTRCVTIWFCPSLPCLDLERREESKGRRRRRRRTAKGTDGRIDGIARIVEYGPNQIKSNGGWVLCCAGPYVCY